jgi:hypothetical protein
MRLAVSPEILILRNTANAGICSTANALTSNDASKSVIPTASAALG